MRAARVSTVLVTGCLAALVLAPAALAAPVPSSGAAPASTTSAHPPARAAATTSTTSGGGAATSTAAPGGPPPCSTDPTADHPVICLPPDSGEDRIGFVPAGDSIEFAAQIVNGGSTASNAKIVIALPPTLRVRPDDPPVRIDGWFPLDSSEGEGANLRCTQSADFRTVVCNTGTLAAGANIVVGIPLHAPDDAQDGQRARFSVTLRPSGTSSFTPSSVSATVQFLGPAHVRTTLTPTRLSVALGHSGTVTAALHNLGPAAAIGTVGLAVVLPASGENPHFLITNSPIDVTDDPTIPATLLHRRALLARQLLGARQPADSAHASAGGHPSPVGFWPIGTIPAGDTAHVPVVVKAVRLGTDVLTFGALSVTDAGNCNADGTACDEIASARLTAVRTAGPDSGRHEPLAATGTRTDAGWVQAAVLLIALGALLVVLGRPVRAARRR